MKRAFIIVTVAGMEEMTKKLVVEMEALKIPKLRIYVIQNIAGQQGYAEGANRGIRKAQKEDPELFFIANPDISLHGISASNLLEASKHFDIWGYAMEQDGVVYYGGEIDKHRLTGGLQTKKPQKRFNEYDFVNGSLIAFTKKALDINGYFDESFKMYYEDVEFCTRAKKNGLRVGVDSEVRYKHFEQSKQNPQKESSLFFSWIKYFKRNASFSQWIRELLRLPKTLLVERDLLLREFKKRPFFYNFMSLNASSFIIKILNFILFLFLIRFLSIRDYGIYNLVWAQIGLLMPLADFGTTSYGILHLKEEKKITFSDIFSLRFVLAIIIAFLTLLFSLFFDTDLRIVALVFLTIPVLYSNALSGSLLILLSSKNKTYLASIVSTVFNMVLILSLITILFVAPSLRNIFLVICFMYVAYAVVIMATLHKEAVVSLTLSRFKAWYPLIKKSFIYVLLGFFAGLYFKIDVFLLNYFKGEQAVGVYSAGYKFFEALLFIGGSYTISATPIFQQFLLKDRKALMKKLRRDSSFLLIGGILLAAAAWVISPYLFPLIISSGYADAVHIFRIVIFALPFLLVSIVYMNILYLLRKTHWVVLVFLFQIALNMVGNILFVPLYSYYASAYLTVLCEIVNMALVMYLFRRAYAHLT